MTLILSDTGVEIKSHHQAFGKDSIHLFHPSGEVKLTMDDFCFAALYIMTSTDLEPNDPRLNFIEEIKKLEKIPGHDKGRERLGPAEEKT